MSYSQYLNGNTFQRFKTLALEFYGHECGQCGSKYNLSVYLKRFIKCGKEKVSDAIVLCDKHGRDFLKDRKKNKKNVKGWINKEDIKEVSSRYVRQIFKNEGLQHPPKDLIKCKQIHIKIKRAINEKQGKSTVKYARTKN